MDHAPQLNTVSMIFMGGMVVALILPGWISFLSILTYVFYQISILPLLWRQIPEKYRFKGGHKLMIFLEWSISLLEEAGYNSSDSDPPPVGEKLRVVRTRGR